MLLLDFFNDNFRILFLTISVLFLFYSSYNARKTGQGRGLALLSFGLLLVFGASLLQRYINFFLINGVSIKIFILFELLLVLAASLFLVMASSRILLNKPVHLSVLFLFVTLGFVLAVSSVFVINDSDLVSNIRQILPVIAMTYVFLSFASEPSALQSQGKLLALFSTAGFIFLMLWPLFETKPYPWHWPADLLYVLGLSNILKVESSLETKLENSERFNRKYIDNIQNIVRLSPFPIILSRLSDDSVIMANMNAVQLFGMSGTEFNRYHLRDFLVDANNRKQFLQSLEHSNETRDFEVLVKTAGGNTPFWLLASVNVIDYNDDLVVYSAFQDITIQKKRESLLQTQADRDPLTSIYNRRYFEKKLKENIEQAHQNKTPFAVLMLDADFFKKINDTYGHKIGDKVLIELAAICERTFRQGDMVARYGGEEFVVFLNNITPEAACAAAERLRANIETSVVYSDNMQPVNFTVSIGVAPSGISDHEDMMIKMADDAMYLAKQNGRNRVEMYSKTNMKNLGHGYASTKNENQLHPIFQDEGEEEISLLDGIETKYMD